ncbi:mitochondrial 50S ribosomal protein L22 [Amylocystis lapponica]|nr:mitochondrial 50S ribosomal protein L22 [Amylocystis lapponica]
MQSVGAGLRSVNTRTTLLQLHQVASGSRAVLWDARRHASPFGWLRESLAMKVRKQASAEEVDAARKEQAEKGQLSVFESLPTDADGETASPITPPRKTYTEHKYSTANFKMSHRKLNKLGRQISGKPIDSAILQMMFSEKRASQRLKSMLALAKSHATGYKGLDEKKLIVAEAWVTKGPNVLKRMDIKGRGRMGIKTHPDSRLHVVLREGKTKVELKAKERERRLKRIISAGIVREDVPIRNPGASWAW